MKSNPYSFLLRVGDPDVQPLLVGLGALAGLLSLAHVSTVPAVGATVAILVLGGAPALASRMVGRGAPVFLLAAAAGVLGVFRAPAAGDEFSLPILFALRVAYFSVPPLVLTAMLDEGGRERIGLGPLHVWAPAVTLLVGSIVHSGLGAAGPGGEEVRRAAFLCAAVYFVLICAALLRHMTRRPQVVAEAEQAMGRGAVLEEQGRFGAAAIAYEREGRLDTAADAARRAADWSRAGRLYQRIGQPYEAGEMFARAQAWPEALAAYEEAKAWSAAARLCLQMGDVERAVALLVKTGDHAGVVRLLEEAGRAPTGEQLRRAGQHARAAELFEAAGEWRRAADVYEHELGDTARAAELHHAHGSYVAAGRLFESSGRAEEAARSFAAAPEGALDAARLLVRQGNVDEASALVGRLPPSQLEQVEDETTAGVVARVMLASGRTDAAIKLLQGMKRRGQMGGVVHLLLGRAFLLKSLPELAEEELRTAAHLPMDPGDEMEARYQLACTLQALGQLDEARSLLRDVIQKDLDYADAQQRYLKLKG